MANLQNANIEYNTDGDQYKKPQLDNSQTILEAPKPVTEYIDPKLATIEGRLPGLLSADSPVLQQARIKGNQAASARGLLNSLGGQQIAESAVLDRAIQIAQPDAALYGGASLKRQEAELAGASNQQLAEIERKKFANNAQITAALADQDAKLKGSLQAMVLDADIAKIELEAHWQQYLNQFQYDEAKKQALLQTSGQMGEALTGSLERILRDTNIVNKSEAITSLMTLYKSQLNTVAAVAGLSLNWS